MTARFAGKNAFVTGGGSGIGLAAAHDGSPTKEQTYGQEIVVDGGLRADLFVADTLPATR